MSLFQLNSSHGASLSPFNHHHVWQRESNHQTPKGSNVSLSTIRHFSNNHLSPNSAESLCSIQSTPLRVTNENVAPTEDPFKDSSSSRKLTPISFKAGSGNVSQDAPSLRHAQDGMFAVGSLEDLDLHEESAQQYRRSSQQIEQDSAQSQCRGFSFELKQEEAFAVKDSTDGAEREEKPSIIVTDAAIHPIKRFIGNLRSNKSMRKVSLSVRKERWSLDDFDEIKPDDLSVSHQRRLGGHKKTSSWASDGFVAAVKSAALGIGSPSILPQSQKGQKSRFLRRSMNRSSMVATGPNRISMDSTHNSVPMFDAAACDRAVQRRKILDELISSEEGYINDLKILAHVYFTILASAPNNPHPMQPGIERNVNEMLDLHEEILIQTKSFRPDSRSALASKDGPQLRPNPSRWLGKGTLRAGRDHTLVCEPQEAADMAKIFGRMMGRFFVYEEYGAKYEMMLQSIASTSKNIPNWYAYERGIEALVNSLLPRSSPENRNKKGLKFEDLVIKPIQRVCRYPLMFAELHNNTPVIDGPEAHAEVEKALYRLRETAKEINKATNDRQTQARIRRTWNLQDLLVFPDVPTALSSLRLLGHAKLCGVLYVAYHSTNELQGQYMLCALFSGFFLLATRKESDIHFEVVAIISLDEVQIEKADDGRGLQCHNALFSWKLTFEHDRQLFELILCACTGQEEEEWKAELLHHSAKENQRQAEDISTPAPEYRLLALKIRPFGTVFGQPGTLTRSLSIQRASNVRPPTSPCLVIIRDTQSLKEVIDMPRNAPTSLSRSHSLSTTNRIPILAPERGERIRMEHAMSNVWTRDLLPFPGMTTRGGFIRSSANSMMRKLSKASVSSSLNRIASNTGTVDDDGCSSKKSLDLMTRIQSFNASPERTPTFGSGAEGHAVVGHLKEGKHVKLSKTAKRRGVSDASTARASQEGAELERVSGKAGSQKTLLKAFSAEGIRNWFI